jgi:hypothetical protein
MDPMAPATSAGYTARAFIDNADLIGLDRLRVLTTTWKPV